ncbi:MAG: hypothetical protein ABI598_03835 [Chloroflexota bacterium]
MTFFRFGMMLASQASTWPEMLDAARRIDRLDYDHLSTCDHLHAIVGEPLQPIYDAFRQFFGPPELVAEKLLEHVAAEFDTTIAEMATPYDIETIERLIGEVKPLVDRG